MEPPEKHKSLFPEEKYCTIFSIPAAQAVKNPDRQG